MHKTGTTSIQATLFKNRRKLLAHDINYLSISENHSTTLYPLFIENPHRYHVNVRAGIDTEQKARRRNAAVEAALQRELERNTSSRLVISGENLIALHPDGIVRLREKLQSFAQEFRVVVYVREPYAYINSAFQQRCRHGATWDEVIAKPPLPRYRRIKKFIDAFGRDSVDIRVFDRARLVNGDLIADFLSAIGAPSALVNELDTVTANVALSHEAALMLEAINRRYPVGTDRKPNPQLPADIVDLLRDVGGRPFHCPDAAFMKAQPNVAEELRWLRRTLDEKVFSARPPRRGGVSEGPSEETLRRVWHLIAAQPAWKRVLRRSAWTLRNSAEAVRRWRLTALP